MYSQYNEEEIILDYFKNATQVGLTATPKESNETNDKNSKTKLN